MECELFEVFMLSSVRKKIVYKLWEDYIGSIDFYTKTFKTQPILDHLAIIDLSSWRSGRNVLKKIFERIGFEKSGEGYLPDKQNDFLWMREKQFGSLKFGDGLPQLVLADFRNDLFSPKAQQIIEALTANIIPFDFDKLDKSLKDLNHGDPFAASAISDQITEYLLTTPWSNPTKKEYEALKKENTLLSWVALFGRRVNHFGVCINELSEYKNFIDFLEHIKKLKIIKLNTVGGEIKGGTRDGIAQASSIGSPVTIKLEGGSVKANKSFMEFVWRYPTKETPQTWDDYFNGFVANNATYVIESLYTKGK